MNDTLKVAGRIGAELGAAKAENDRLRGLLQQVVDCQAEHYGDGCGLHLSMITLAGRIKDALSQQPEPTDTYTAVDMATAAAQGFRDGYKAEPAQAQDEREAFEAWFLSKWPANQLYRRDALPASDPRYDEYCNPHVRHAYEGWLGRAARPAQTEQQPVLAVRVEDDCVEHFHPEYGGGYFFTEGAIVEMYATPIAQTAPQGKFRIGDLVKKSTGSEWVGRVVGWYSTEQTKEGYAVESSAHRNSVQIYPAKALEAVE